MVGWYEVMGERTDPKDAGKVRINTFYETQKKPLWLILLKLSGLFAMVAVGFALLLPSVPLPLWQSIALASGCMLIYVGIAFFVRPEPNGDNMGFLGGMFNDPTHYSDNISRALWNAHCFLGPGRFVVETILDCSTRLGFTAEISAEQANREEQMQQCEAIQQDVMRWREEAGERIEQRRDALPSGQVELSSARFLDPDRFGG